MNKTGLSIILLVMNVFLSLVGSCYKHLRFQQIRFRFYPFCFFLVGWAIFFFLGCKNDPKEPQTVKDLVYYSERLKRTDHPYNSSKWVENYQTGAFFSPFQHKERVLSLGLELIRAGKTQTAINKLDSLIHSLEEQRVDYDKPLLNKARTYLGMAYLRLGEEQNCILNHSKYSCILPLDSSATYTLRESAKSAITVFERLLDEHPDDHESRYLMNLAYMTLGEYPKKVPKEYLIKHPLFNEPPKRMVIDRAMEKNLATVGLAGGVIAEDFDLDGHIDLMTSSWDMQTTIKLHRNMGNGEFKEVSAEAGLNAMQGGLNMMQTDYDGDGRPDVFILRGGWLGLYGKLPNTLLRNNGKGENGKITFTDVTEEVGLSGNYPTQTAVWADFDNDGRLDAFVGNESTVTGFKFPSQLFLNGSEGTFREIAGEAGVRINDSLAKQQYTIKGVAAGDYDNDGWVDIYVSTRDGANFLFKNEGVNPNGTPTFTDVTDISGLGGIHKTFTCWFWDYNNDGHEDILAAGFDSSSHGEGKSISHDFGLELQGMESGAQRGMLFKNNGNGTFTDVSKQVDLDKILYMMGGNFGDIDNDGWLDFYCGNGDPDLRSVIPNRMFRFNGSKFEEITNRGFGHIQKGHGIAFADFNKNGSLDIFMTVGGFFEGDVYQDIFFENQIQSNNYIAIKLIGTESNSVGIGSRIRVFVKENDSIRVLHRTVNSGGSFGASPLTQHIGIGKATEVEKVEIHWYGSNKVQVVEGLQGNEHYEFTESESNL